jgi:hypothetical protein
VSSNLLVGLLLVYPPFDTIDFLTSPLLEGEFPAKYLVKSPFLASS